MIVSCNSRLQERKISKGNADFSSYVAVGNSLTAGYADGALYREGQENSYPKMLWEQFSLVTYGEFNIPYLGEGGGNNGGGTPRRILGYTIPCNSNTPTLTPILDKNNTPLTNVSNMAPFNLMGIPGVRMIDANLGIYSLLNPFLNRLCLNPGVSTLVSEAMRAKPTFFTFWLGNNDVLLYAVNGAVKPTQITSPALSDTQQFRLNLDVALDSLTKYGAKGMIANIPEVTSVPYFTTIPWNGIVLSDSQAMTLNILYTSLGLSHITWQSGANGFLIEDSTAAPYIRKATAKDLILLSTPLDSVRCAQWGTSPLKPLRNTYVLTESEINVIKNYTQIFNQSIYNASQKYNLAFADMYSYFNTFAKGIVYNGVTLNTSFVSGGAFSLDGVHPTPKGYALIANEFIKSINQHYNATLPLLDVNKYRGNLFP